MEEWRSAGRPVSRKGAAALLFFVAAWRYRLRRFAAIVSLFLHTYGDQSVHFSEFLSGGRRTQARHYIIDLFFIFLWARGARARTRPQQFRQDVSRCFPLKTVAQDMEELFPNGAWKQGWSRGGGLMDGPGPRGMQPRSKTGGAGVKLEGPTALPPGRGQIGACARCRGLRGEDGTLG